MIKCGRYLYLFCYFDNREPNTKYAEIVKQQSNYRQLVQHMLIWCAACWRGWCRLYVFTFTVHSFYYHMIHIHSSYSHYSLTVAASSILYVNTNTSS